MPGESTDVWDVMSTARAIRRITDQPVDDATLARCLEAATDLVNSGKLREPDNRGQ
jgi:hypothetical protein